MTDIAQKQKNLALKAKERPKDRIGGIHRRRTRYRQNKACL